MPAPANSVRGFTLVEALIVLLIFSLSAAVAYPTLRDWQVRFSEKAELRTVVNAFHQARAEAARRNCNVVVRFLGATNPKGQGIELVANGTSLASTFRPLKALKFDPDNTNFPANQEGFDFRGMPASNKSGKVTFSGSKNNEYIITMSRTGRVAVN